MGLSRILQSFRDRNGLRCLIVIIYAIMSFCYYTVGLDTGIFPGHVPPVGRPFGHLVGLRHVLYPVHGRRRGAAAGAALGISLRPGLHGVRATPPGPRAFLHVSRDAARLLRRVHAGAARRGVGAAPAVKPRAGSVGHLRRVDAAGHTADDQHRLPDGEPHPQVSCGVGDIRRAAVPAGSPAMAHFGHGGRAALGAGAVHHRHGTGRRELPCLFSSGDQITTPRDAAFTGRSKRS